MEPPNSICGIRLWPEATYVCTSPTVHSQRCKCVCMSHAVHSIPPAVTAPVDMIKTHMFVNGHKYASPQECLADIYRQHGIRGLFRG